ncbi:Thymidine phosphorylase [Defluviimonas aquaemixtae]|uniref:Thymidine phosphorylase n=1 Tax=Albidovulum aquaemixtae TaxID=1542388 RepID=A0A2R8B3R9_9RHOB|nr:thymidine phosphorylase [Defluviimonas aquaemixtae]SPH17133.1 Thymidine phosphorylase [Defluviimonas aquaemixtae]
MDARRIIAGVRDGKGLSPEAAVWFAKGLASDEVTDAQAGAFAMAVLLKGLDQDARVALTEAMRDSGDVLEWNLPGPVIDKHSTGGIGDCTSLLLAPALAACGAYVPMISGRGLGHTGGTLDKLEAIPGFRTGFGTDDLHRLVAEHGCAIVSAGADMAPADRRLYAIRDVSGTVESIDLITASILSKKLAAGLEALVLDVKVGSGAFMKSMEDAEALAEALVITANGAGCRTAALITDMDQPLASSAGNALEVLEVMETLTGVAVNQALWDVTVQLGGEALALGGLVADAEEGCEQIDEALESGRAAEIFGRMVAAQGGPSDFVDRYPDRLPAAPVVLDVAAAENGFVTAIDGEVLGHAVVLLGGGRLRGDDRINPSVGLSEIMPLGEPIERGEAIARIHAATQAAAEDTARAVAAAIRISPEEPEEPPLIHARIGP